MHLLYPLERHNENTLYSAVAANPDIFVPLGNGVFGPTMVESSDGHSGVNWDGFSPRLVAFDGPIEMSTKEPETAAAVETFIGRLEDFSQKYNTVEFPVEVLQRIVISSENLKGQRFWSLGELGWTLRKRKRLLSWAESPSGDFSSLPSNGSRGRSLFTGLDRAGTLLKATCRHTSAIPWERDWGVAGSVYPDCPGADSERLRKNFGEGCRTDTVGPIRDFRSGSAKMPFRRSRYRTSSMNILTSTHRLAGCGKTHFRICG